MEGFGRRRFEPGHSIAVNARVRLSQTHPGGIDDHPDQWGDVSIRENAIDVAIEIGHHAEPEAAGQPIENLTAGGQGSHGPADEAVDQTLVQSGIRDSQRGQLGAHVKVHELPQARSGDPGLGICRIIGLVKCVLDPFERDLDARVTVHVDEPIEPVAGGSVERAAVVEQKGLNAHHERKAGLTKCVKR